MEQPFLFAFLSKITMYLSNFTSAHNLGKQVKYWLKTRVRKISEKVTSICVTVLFNILLLFNLFPKPKAVKRNEERGAHSFLRYQERFPAFVPFVKKGARSFLVPQKKECVPGNGAPRNAFLMLCL